MTDQTLADALRAATPDQVAAALSIPAGDVGLIGEAKIELRWHDGGPLWRLSWRERWGVGPTLDAALESRLGVAEKLEPQPSRRAAIIAGAKLYYAARGRRPSTSSGSATAYVGFEVTWPGLDSGLRRGRYGPATSLAELLTEHGIGGPVEVSFAAGLGGKIKRARLAAGMTRAEFAKRIGYSKHTVRAWENNEIRPSASALRRVAEATGRNLRYFRVGQ